MVDDTVGRIAGARYDACTADQAACQIVDDVTVQIRHDHHVELLRVANHLHAGVVDDHRVELDVRIVLGGLLAASQKEAIRQLHDVRLVHGGHLLSAQSGGIIERELGDSTRFLFGDDLHALDYAGHRLVLERRIFTLGLLSNRDEVDVGMARVNACECAGGEKEEAKCYLDWSDSAIITQRDKRRSDFTLNT